MRRWQRGFIAPFWHTAAARGTGNTDPFWSSVKTLLGNDSQADGSTTFADQSGSAHTFTANGNIQYDTAQAPTGLTSSVLGDGVGDYLSAPSHADFAAGTGDFTVDFFVRFTVATGNQMFWHANVNGGLSFSMQSGTLGLARHNVANDLTYAWNPSTNTWYHVAVMRTGTTVRIGIDGTIVASGTAASDYLQGAGIAMNNATVPASWGVNGHCASIRYTKGVGRWTANFTPPTLPLPTS